MTALGEGILFKVFFPSLFFHWNQQVVLEKDGGFFSKMLQTGNASNEGNNIQFT